MSLAVNHLIGFGARLANGAGLPASYGADITSTSYVIYSTQDGAYPATNAFDNNTGTTWYSTSSAINVWLGQDFGSGVTKTPRKVTITFSTAGGASATYWPDTATLQYSDNGSAWTDVNEWYSAAPTLTLAQNTTPQSFEFEDGGAHRYWRFKMPDETYRAVGEIEMFEAA